MNTVGIFVMVFVVALVIFVCVTNELQRREDEREYIEDIKRELREMDQKGIKYDLYFTADGDVEILVRGSN